MQDGIRTRSGLGIRIDVRTLCHRREIAVDRRETDSGSRLLRGLILSLNVEVVDESQVQHVLYLVHMDLEGGEEGSGGSGGAFELLARSSS